MILRFWVPVFVLTAALSWSQDFPPRVFLDFRSQSGLSVPAWDDALAASARSRATVLASEGRLSHQDSQGRGPALQLAGTGYPPGEFGEVLGAGGDPGAVWQAWLTSPPHRAVLTTPGWTRWAWASAPAGASRVWVMRFWKP